jgi:hypothetical protein
MDGWIFPYYGYLINLLCILKQFFESFINNRHKYNHIILHCRKKRGEWMFNKKASLEISIQAIVIVVLAMTLLGLGLGFVRGLFKTITSTTEDVTEQVRQKILDDLITGDKKVSFPKTEIIIDKGESTILTVGIRNKGDQPLDYKMRFTSVSGPDGAGGTSPSGPDELKGWFQFSEQSSVLTAADSDVRNIRISIPTGSSFIGSYFLTFEVLENPFTSSNIYAQKDFFIVVRG